MFLFSSLLLLPLILSASNDYPTSGTIANCESQSDPSEDNCKVNSDNDFACCYGEYTGGKKCFKIPRNYRFALDSVSTYKDQSGNEYPGITFTCNQPSALCGTNSPDEIFQCREHSSKQNSCCYIEQGDKTDCILADSKFPNQTVNETLGDTLVVCGSNFANMNILYFIILLFIIIEL